MTVGIIGAGAFGAALALALGRQTCVTLWGRGLVGRDIPRLPGIVLPDSVTTTANLEDLDAAQTVLLALPAQQLGSFLAHSADDLDGRSLVACCKGIDLTTMLGPTSLIAKACPRSTTAILTGPSFATDIAHGLPTALTLACANDAEGAALQQQLSTSTLRLYRTTDVIGAELGGALKNVIAIAAGVVIGAGLGHSARAALMTRGFAEMERLALHLGARRETLVGLSGFGDLVLTCTSDQSRNFRYGQALGAGQPFDTDITVEGAATARAIVTIARQNSIDLPITGMVAALTTGQISLQTAIGSLMSRPLKQE